MSFYGSVYYQLVDTFYKIIVKNNGDKTYAFNDDLINPSGTAEQDIITSPAVGRKGVFSLDSGNYWINFSKIPKENDEDVTDAAPYRIWHSPAHDDPETSKRISSWDIESDQYTYEKDEKGMEKAVYNKDGVEMKAGTDYIQLQDHEFIRMYPSHYDEAGHIIDQQTTPTLYRLPKSDVNEQVNWLLGLIGEPSEDKKLPMWEIPEEERTEGLEQNKDNSVMTLSDYAEKNYADLRTLESFVGDWSTIAEYWGEDWYMAPSITEFLGKIEDMFNDPSVEANNYEEFKNWFNQGWTLTKIIGELPKMWRTINDGGSNIPVSFVDAIVKLSENLSTYKTEMSKRLAVIDAAIEGHGLQIDNIQDTIGTDTRNLGSIYPALNNLQDAIAAEGDARRAADQTLQTNIDNEATNRFNADTTLQNNIDDEARTRAANDETLQGNIDAEATTRETNDKTLQDNIDAEETERIRVVGALSDAVYAKIAEEKAALQKEIDDDNTLQSTTLTSEYQAADIALDTKLTNALTTAQNTLQGEIDAVEAKHDEEYESLESRVKKTEDTLGTAPNTTTVFKRLEDADTAIGKLESSLGTIGSTTNVGAELTAINNKIGSLSDIAGTATVYGAIASTNAAVRNVEQNYLTQTNASNIYLTQTNAANTYLTADDISTMSSDVAALKEVAEAVANIEIDGQKVDGQNVATLLTQILNKIEGINARIDELHPVSEPQPDPDPAPDNGEGGGETIE